MPATGAVVTLLAGELLILLLVRALARRAVTSPSRIPAAAARTLAATAVGVVLIGAGAFTTVPLYVAAAGVAALCTALAIGVRLELAGIMSGPAYALPSLVHRAPGTPGAVTGLAAAGAAGAAFLAAAMAYGTRLLGPSDPALVALAAYLGMLLECGLEATGGTGAGAATARAALSALLAAGLAAALVILLP
ncbi:MAG: hypothetical protein PVJ49_17730 [Acidobacteriota bacterium]|jgi:hypothetical protein